MICLILEIGTNADEEKDACGWGGVESKYFHCRMQFKIGILKLALNYK